MGAQIGGAKPGDRPLAAPEGEEEAVVGFQEQIEATEGVTLDLGWCGDLGDGLLPGIGVIEAGHEGEVAVVGGVQELAQVAQAIDVLAQWGKPEHGLAVALFHVAVVLEEGDLWAVVSTRAMRPNLS